MDAHKQGKIRLDRAARASLISSASQPFGFETLDIRYGGLRARLDTMQTRITAYLDTDDNSVSSLPELEVETLPIWPSAGPSLMLGWDRASRPTVY